MAIVLFLKSHVKAYTRKDGTYVADHTTKVQKKAPAPKKPTVALFGKDAPLDLTGAKITAVPPKSGTKPASGDYKGSKSPSQWKGNAHSTSKPHKPPLFTPSLPPKAAVAHPKAGEDGKPFLVHYPSKPSAEETWAAPTETAVFVPGGAAPAALNGVRLSPWSDHPRTTEGWEFVEGQMPDLDEPPMDLKGKEPAAGVFVEEPDGRVWMVCPSNGFAGYKTTFPKGHADDGISLQATAIKEAFEESGLKVEITGFIGDVERTTTTTRYYRARRVGGSPVEMGWESQAVMLVPKERAHAALNRQVDRNVATLAGINPPEGLAEAADDWKKVGKQLGSNPGGFYQDAAGHQWYVKVPKSTAIARNEILAGKLYEAAGVRVPELKQVTVNDKTAIASRVIPGLEKFTDGGQHVDGVMDGFAVDAWLANWDVVGLAHDNLLVDEEGRAVRVDVGGSLIFRAQGEPKGKAFGPEVGELETLTSGKNPQAAAVFGHITHAELVAGIDRIAAVSEAKIRTLCQKYGPGTPEQRDSLADTLIARRAHLLELR